MLIQVVLDRCSKKNVYKKMIPVVEVLDMTITQSFDIESGIPFRFLGV
jgi:hypothetical protein